MDINDIENIELRKRILAVPDDRLKDYYRDFVLNHKKVIYNYNLKNYDDMPMRNAIIALSKALFHEVFGEEAKNYYSKGKDGNRFILSNSESIVFCFNGREAFKKKRSELESGDFGPRGEILQIAAAVAYKKKFGQNDDRYMRFKLVHSTVYASESNDKAHVSADVDKSIASLDRKFSDYRMFVVGVLDDFKSDFKIPLLDYIPQGLEADYGRMKQHEVVGQKLTSEATQLLIDRLNDEIKSPYPSPLILLAPKDVDAQIAWGLARMPWNLIITFDSNDSELFSVIKIDWEGKRPYKIGEIEGDGRDVTGIIFANGESAKDAKGKYKDWRNAYENKITSALNRIRKGDEGITAVCLTDPSDAKIFNKGGIGLLNQNDRALIIGKIGKNLEDGLDDEFSIKEQNVEKFDIPSEQLAYALKTIDVPEVRDSITASSILSAEDIKRLAAHGIKIVSPIPLGTEKIINHISGFFSGDNVTAKDLYKDYDVKRYFYENFKETIKTRLVNGNRFTHYIKQTPSSGATTVAMRLAYDLSVLSEKAYFKTPITAIYISELKTESVNPLIERIKDLAIKVSPNILLAFVDRSIQSGDFERIKESLTDGGSLKISFIRISEKDKGTSEYTTLIDDKIRKQERPDFIAQYKNNFRAISQVDEPDWSCLEYVIEFPLSLNDSDKKNIDIKDYINNVIGKFSGSKENTIRELISLIGFSSKYIINTDSFVDSFLFNGKIGKPFSDWYKNDLTGDERNAFERLIKFEEIVGSSRQRTGRVRTKFSKFNNEIIKVSNSSLTELAIDYINLFFSQSSYSDKLLNDYIVHFFFKKNEYEDDNSEYVGKKDDQKFYTKLSSVFNDIRDVDSIEGIIEELGKHIGDNPRFLMAKAQYIYNRAYFINSEEHDSKVFDNARDILEELLDSTDWLHDNESITYQSLGVLYFRKLGALRKLPEKTAELELVAGRYIENVVKYCDKANDANPCDTHALVTKAQALKSYLNLTRDILGLNKNDFKFCESDKYLEWTSQYENTLDIINGFIVNIDRGNTTASQNKLISIYEELRSFKSKLIGLPIEQVSEKVYDLYKKELSSNIGKELKTLYANRLFDELVEAPNNEIRNEKIGRLNDNKLTFIEQKLKDTIRGGNLKAYEKIFRIHLFNSRCDYKISDEIQWLKDWIEKDKNVTSQLWGNYYIAMLYFSKVLQLGYDQKGYRGLAEEYIGKSKEFADTLKRNDTKEFFYFRNAQGLQCITENANKAKFVEGYIVKIFENRKGVAKLDCGLEATFAPQGRFLMEDADKHLRIRAKVGFRFSGLGLYGVERIEDVVGETDEINISDESPYRDTDVLNHESPAFDYNNSETSGSIESQTSLPCTDIKAEDEEEYGLEEGYVYSGVYHHKRGKQYVTGKWKEKWIPYLNIEGAVEDGIYDEAEVEFCVKKTVASESGNEKWIAFDVRFPKDY